MCIKNERSINIYMENNQPTPEAVASVDGAFAAMKSALWWDSDLERFIARWNQPLPSS